MSGMHRTYSELAQRVWTAIVVNVIGFSLGIAVAQFFIRCT